MTAWRIGLVLAGLGLGLFGLFRLLTQIPTGSLLALGVWLVLALIIHDGLLAPAVVTTGWLVRRSVADRPRRYLQFAVIIASLVTVSALPMIFLRGSQPAVKALLLRDYGMNLILIVGTVAVVTLAVFAARRPGPGAGSGRSGSGGG